MEIESTYQKWLEKAADPEIQKELSTMDEVQKHDAFYQELEFGTGGLRGRLGAGTNRMNLYTVRRATQGLCDYLLENNERTPTVAIAYDSRRHSDLFARETACVLAANGCTVHLFPTLAPTPMLSFAVRSLSCCAGIVITASHNPAQYNGYKVYGADGCQITLEMADAILIHIRQVDLFADIHTMPFKQALDQERIRMIPETLNTEFIRTALDCRIDRNLLAHTNLRIIYTPLNGTGSRPIQQAFAACGFHALRVVPEQKDPDEAFSTCPRPNPEEHAAFAKALELADKHPADLLLATDPDCDRVGTAVRNRDGKYVQMTGNETGCLLLDYILSQRQKHRTLPKEPVIIKTIVTSAMAYAIAKAYGAQIIDTLTGFKFIGEQIGLLESKGEENRFVFGFEESYGCLPGTYVRDKDAVSTSILIGEMAAYYKKQGKTLLEAMDDCYRKYGFWQHQLLSFTYKGETGTAQIKQIMDAFRADRFDRFAGSAVCKKSNYLQAVSLDTRTRKLAPLHLPKSNVLVFALEQDGEVVLRPSGTEPKLKCYLTVRADDMSSAKERLHILKQDVEEKIQGILHPAVAQTVQSSLKKATC